MTIDRLSLYAKYRVFLCFLCKSFANRDYSALIFNYEKAHRISKFSIKPFRRLVSDIFGVSFELEANYHVQMKIYFCFHWPFLKRIDMLCKLWFALFFGFFFFSVISVNAWQGLKSWYTIITAGNHVTQRQQQ